MAYYSWKDFVIVDDDKKEYIYTCGTYVYHSSDTNDYGYDYMKRTKELKPFTIEFLERFSNRVYSEGVKEFLRKLIKDLTDL